MIIYDRCPHCQAQATLKSSASTPQDLERDRGERFIATCDECATAFDVEAMRTRAKVNPSKVLTGLALSIALAALIWNLGYIALIAAAPLFMMIYVEQSAVANYNKLSKRKWG